MNSERAASMEVGIVENITIKLHDIDQIRRLFPDWPDLASYERWLTLLDPGSINVEALSFEKHGLTRDRAADLLGRTPPTPTEEKTSNLTTSSLHEYIVDNLHPDIDENENATHLAVGDDDGPGTSIGNTELNNEVYRTEITDSLDNGNELLSSTFLDSTEANGFDLVECGLFTASNGGLLLNHSTFEVIEKSNQNTAVIDVTLRFENPA